MVVAAVGEKATEDAEPGIALALQLPGDIDRVGAWLQPDPVLDDHIAAAEPPDRDRPIEAELGEATIPLGRDRAAAPAIGEQRIADAIARQRRVGLGEN